MRLKRSSCVAAAMCVVALAVRAKTIDKGITVRGVRASATIIRPSAVGVKLFLLKHAMPSSPT